MDMYVYNIYIYIYILLKRRARPTFDNHFVKVNGAILMRVLAFVSPTYEMNVCFAI